MTSRQLLSRFTLVTALRTVSAMLAVVSFATSTQAAVIDADPSNYQGLVSTLAPGDTLRLASGTYTEGLSLGGEAGTASQPIVVSGPPDQSAVFTARDCCNTVQFDATSYVHVLNLTLDGGGRAGPSGVDARGSSHHITLENLKIVGHNGSQQTVGISYEGEGTNSGRHLALSTSAATNAPAPSLTLSDYPAQLSAQENSTHQWSIEDATSCATAQGLSGSKQRSGLETAGPAGTDSRYSATCIDARSLAAKSVQMSAVTAAATPTVTLSASPGAVAVGGTSMLSWASTGADGCSASGGWAGTKAPNGSETVGPLQATMSFRLTCLGAGGNADAVTQITVGGASPPPTTPPPATPPPTTPPPTTPPPATPPPTTPPPATPPPTTPPPTTPPPTTPPTTPPPATGEATSGGGGRLDTMLIGFLALFALNSARRRSARTRVSSDGQGDWRRPPKLP